MTENYMKLVEHSPYIYLSYNGKTREVLQGNLTARELFWTQNGFPSLDDLFKPDSLQNLQHEAETNQVAHAWNITAIKQTGENFRCDAEIRPIEPKDDLYFIVLTPRVKGNLTGLRELSFEERVSQLIEESAPGMSHAMIFIDLDNFKSINTSLGHGFGDLTLATVAYRLKALVRNSDVVGRVGEDEFVVFLHAFIGDKLVPERGQLILDTLSQDYVNNEGRANITASLGISLFPQHGTTYESLYNRAEIALNHSKKRGKHCMTIYDKSLDS